jgi:hypothetical protein
MIILDIDNPIGTNHFEVRLKEDRGYTPNSAYIKYLNDVYLMVFLKDSICNRMMLLEITPRTISIYNYLVSNNCLPILQCCSSKYLTEFEVLMIAQDNFKVYIQSILEISEMLHYSLYDFDIEIEDNLKDRLLTYLFASCVFSTGAKGNIIKLSEFSSKCASSVNSISIGRFNNIVLSNIGISANIAEILSTEFPI